ncbi:MAG: response regulator [Nitrospirae bacterium]|nr:response regulator [Nitrospirota bacterium]
MAYKVLLADDSITIQKVVELILSEEDAIVESVGDGSAAMNSLERKRPDIVLADIEMPRMNGYELCRKIKERRETGGIPVILLAGAFESFDEGLARSVGADDFIIKPFETNDLLDKIEYFLSATEGEVFTTGETVSFEGAAATSAAAPYAVADEMQQREWLSTEPVAELAVSETMGSETMDFAPESGSATQATAGDERTDVPDLVSDGEEFGDTEDLWDAEEIPFSEAFEAGASGASDWTEAVPAGAAEADAVIEGMTESDEELDTMTEADTEYAVESDAYGEMVESDKTFEISAVTEAETVLDTEEEAQMLTEAEEEEEVVPLEVLEEEVVEIAEAVEAEEEIAEALAVEAEAEEEPVVAVAEAIEEAPAEEAIPVAEAEETAEAVELEEAELSVEQAEAEVAFMEAIVEAVEAIDETGAIDAEVVAVEEDGEAEAVAEEPVVFETAETDEEAGIAESVEIEAELEKLEEAILEKAAEISPASVAGAPAAMPAMSRDEIMQWVREAVNEALAGFAEAESAEQIEEAPVAPAITRDEILAAMNLPKRDEIIAMVPTHDEIIALLPTRDEIVAGIAVPTRDEIIAGMDLPKRDEIIAMVPTRDEILSMARETIAASVPTRADVDAMIRETVAETVKASLADSLPTASAITAIAREEIATRVPSKSEIEGLAATAMNEVRAFGCEAVNRAIADDFIADLKAKAEGILWDIIPEASERLINEIMKDAVAAKIREAEIISESTKGVIQGIISTSLPGTIKESVEKVTWEVIPEIAKNIIAEEIRKIRAGK